MSAVVCPQCQAPIHQDFGVVTCSQCGSVVMIDINGQVTLSGGSAVEASPAANSAAPTASAAEYVNLTPIDPATPFPGLEPLGPEHAPGAVFREIEDFGNQDLHSGPLHYSLRIEGLDRGDLKRKLSEILSDSRLNLDANQVMATLSHGKLEMTNLNPVKVTYIVSRLRHLPLKISWRQSAFQN